MSVIYCTGFDYGTVAGISNGNTGNKVWDSVSTPAVTTSNPRSGAYALNLTGTSAIRSVTLNSNTLGSPTALAASFWVKFPSALPSNSPDLCCFSTNGNDGFMFFQASNSKLGVAWAGGSTIDGPVVTFDTWYQIDMLIDATSNPHSLSWRVNGVAQTGTTTAFAAGTVSTWALGRVDAVSGTYHFDDVVLANTAAEYPLGPHKVVLLLPDQSSTLAVNGSTANWNTFAGATPTETAWSEPTARAAIDDVPLTVGASQDGIAQVARTDSTHYVEIPMTTYTLAGGETISGARMHVPGWAATTTAATFGFRSWNGTTETVLQAGTVDPNFDNTSTPFWVSKQLTTADINTQAELDALAMRIGFSSDVSPHIGIHAMYVEVAIKQAPAAPTTVAAVASVPAVTVSTGGGSDATATPSAVATSAAVPAPTLSAGSTIAATAVVVTASVPAPAFTSSAVPTPASVAAVAAVGAVTLSTGSRVSPSAVAATASAPAPTLSAGSAVSAASVAGVASVPAATVSASGNVTVSASAVAGVASVSAPTATTGSTVTATTVAAAAGIGAATVTTGSTAQPAVVATTASVPAATPRTGSTLTLTTVAGVAAIAGPTVTIGAQAAPDSVGAVASIGTLGLATGSAVDVASVAAYASVGAVTVTTLNRITYRPDTGTTARVSTGVTVRPDLGTTYRP